MTRSRAGALRLALAAVGVVAVPVAAFLLLGTPELARPSSWAEAQSGIDGGSWPPALAVDIITAIAAAGWLACIWYLVAALLGGRRRGQRSAATVEPGAFAEGPGAGAEADAEPWYLQSGPLFDEPFTDVAHAFPAPDEPEEPAADEPSPHHDPAFGGVYGGFEDAEMYQAPAYPPEEPPGPVGNTGGLSAGTGLAGGPGGSALAGHNPEQPAARTDVAADSQAATTADAPKIIPVRAYYLTQAADNLRSVAAQFLNSPTRWEELRALNASNPGVVNAGPDTLLPVGTALFLPGDPLPWGTPDPVHLWTLAETFLFAAWGREPSPEEVAPFWRGLSSGAQRDLSELPQMRTLPGIPQPPVAEPDDLDRAVPPDEPAYAPPAAYQAPPETPPEYEAPPETPPEYPETPAAYEAPPETPPEYQAPPETPPAYEAPPEYQAPPETPPAYETPPEYETFDEPASPPEAPEAFATPTAYETPETPADYETREAPPVAPFDPAPAAPAETLDEPPAPPEAPAAYQAPPDELEMPAEPAEPIDEPAYQPPAEPIDEPAYQPPAEPTEAIDEPAYQPPAEPTEIIETPAPPDTPPAYQPPDTPPAYETPGIPAAGEPGVFDPGAPVITDFGPVEPQRPAYEVELEAPAAPQFLPSLTGSYPDMQVPEADLVAQAPRSLAGTALGDAMMLWQLGRLRRRRPGSMADQTAENVMEQSLRQSARVETLNLIEAAMRHLRAVTVGQLKEKPAVLAVRVGAYGFEVLLDRPVEPPEGWKTASGGFVMELPDGVGFDELDAVGQGPSLCPSLVPVGDTYEGPLLLNLEQIGCLIVSGPGNPAERMLNSVVAALASSPMAGDIRVVTVGLGPWTGLLGSERVHSISFDSRELEELMSGAQSGTGSSLDVLIVGPGNDLLIQRAGQIATASLSRLAVVGATSSPAARWPWRVHVDDTATAVVHPIACTMMAAQTTTESLASPLDPTPPMMDTLPRFQ